MMLETSEVAWCRYHGRGCGGGGCLSEGARADDRPSILRANLAPIAATPGPGLGKSLECFSKTKTFLFTQMEGQLPFAIVKADKCVLGVRL